MEPRQRPPPCTPITPIEPRAAIEALGIDGGAQQAVHATALARFDVAAATSRGALHADNEDAHTELDGRCNLFVVADGVGGGAMAPFASRMLVRELHAALDGRRLDGELVNRAMLDADRAIARAIAASTELPGAATVVLAAPVDAFAARWLIGWVGDCRAYRWAAGAPVGPELLTRDDTFGGFAETPPPGGSPDDPARMVGNGATDGANVLFVDLAVDDLLVLCSDGVHKYLEPSAWREALQRSGSLARCCEALVGRARGAGSTDDATVLVVRRARGFSVRRPRWISRLAGRGPGSGARE